MLPSPKSPNQPTQDTQLSAQMRAQMTAHRNAQIKAQMKQQMSSGVSSQTYAKMVEMEAIQASDPRMVQKATDEYDPTKPDTGPGMRRVKLEPVEQTPKRSFHQAFPDTNAQDSDETETIHSQVSPIS